MLQSPDDRSIPEAGGGDGPSKRDSAGKQLSGAPRDRFRAGVVLGTIVTIAVVLLIVQNGESAQLDWISFHFRMPLWILLSLTAAAGAVVWEIIKIGWRRGRRLRQEQKKALAGAKKSGR